MLLSQWNGVQQSHEDLGRKFNSTYVLARIPKHDDPVTVFIESCSWNITDRDVGVMYTVKGKVRTNKESCLYKEFDIIKALPEPGVYSLNNDGIALVRRIPARQFSEGLHRHNTQVLVNGQIPLGNIGWETAMPLFAEQRDLPVEVALKMVAPNKSVRVNRHYWLLAGDKKGNVGLMRDNCRVGSWATGTFFYSSAAKILKEELKDELGFHA